MTLPDFIDANMDVLIIDWTAYTRGISPMDSHLDNAQLRNSARELLTRIADDMREEQDPSRQAAKSRGERPGPDSDFNRVGRTHADDRLSHGFAINALVAEFRTLRASVLRRWQQSAAIDTKSFQEMIRFNEAIDQMLAESVGQFAKRTEQLRDLCSGVLAHDLRSPVGAIVNSTHTIMRDENLSLVSLRPGANLQRSAERVKVMIDDLFVFTRTRLGDQLPVERTRQDFGRICHGAVDEVCASNPGAEVGLKLAGELTGIWDGGRMTQLVVNLLTNANHYGSGAISVKAVGNDHSITLTVANDGAPITSSAIPTLFDPLTRVPSEQKKGVSPGMGLGLYICRCITRSHEGTITVASDDTGTVFTAEFPCFPAEPR